MRIPLPKIQAAAPAVKKPVPTTPTSSAPTPPAAEAVLSERRPSPARSKIPLKSVSIGKILRPEVEEKKEEAQKEILRNDFSEIDLLATWNEYAEQIKNSDLDIYTTLTKNAPSLKDKTIELKIFNKAQEHDISEIKADLLSFIRNRLNNYEISLITFIEKGAAEEGLYTSADKYKKLVEKNPLLEELRKKLDLDLGF
ncbi:MAG: hypothetical protein NT150_04165 [Bacteroidetes bacterium]|nr:hypothetical protein [Bacteroidota bacterium]